MLTLTVLHPPIGHNATLVAPIITQNRSHKFIVKIVIYAIKLVVRSHKTIGVGFLYTNFKAFKIDFS